MPQVRIDLNSGCEPVQVRAIADVVHDAIIAGFRLPAHDHFQTVTGHPVCQTITEEASPGPERGDGVVVIQILTQCGRSDAAQLALYRSIAHWLEVEGVRGCSIFLGRAENDPECWGFGFEPAQHLMGKFAVARAS